MPNDVSAQFSESTARLFDMVSGYVEAASGYRAKAEAAGFCPSAAEQMAVEFHGVLIAGLSAQMWKDQNG
jgi:hypothetical protein